MSYLFGRELLLAQKLSHNTRIKEIADYAAASFENPQSAIKVFAGLGQEFIRFSAALPKTNEANPAHALIYHAGQQDGYVSYESAANLSKMLFELAGIDSQKQSQPVEFTISPLTLMVFLGACDVILQGRYEGGWYTAAAVQNAFDISGDKDFNRLCAPIAYLASTSIYQEMLDENAANSLIEMVEDGILESDEIDGVQLYSFTPQYRYLPAIFHNTKNRLAILRYADEEISIYYVITNQTGTWGFTVTIDSGKVERLDELKFKEMCDYILSDKRNMEKLPAKFCSNCGSPLKVESRFCGNCGKPLL